MKTQHFDTQPTIASFARAYKCSYCYYCDIEIDSLWQLLDNPINILCAWKVGYRNIYTANKMCFIFLFS